MYMYIWKYVVLNTCIPLWYGALPARWPRPPLGTGWQRVRCTLCHVYWTLRHGIGQRVSVASSCASLIKVYADPAEEFTNETRWFLTKYSMGVSGKVYNYSVFVIKYGDDSWQIQEHLIIVFFVIHDVDEDDGNCKI